MSFFGGLMRMVPRLLGGLFKGGARRIGSMAIDKAKEAAINLAKQKAAEVAANAARGLAEKTGVAKLIGQDAIDQGASALGGAASTQAGNFFQK